MSQFNLFSCHKYLERVGAQLLTRLATCDAYDLKTIDDIAQSMANFLTRLKGHAAWEEHFVFKLLPEEAIADEQKFHREIDGEIDLIYSQLSSLQTTSSSSLHQIYLQFRKFYSELLTHLHDEDTAIMNQLREKYSESDLRKIDFDIYQSMSADEMIAMSEELLPPCNFGEKMALLEDLKSANASSLFDA